MYLSNKIIEKALQVLEKIHPFWGNTFLAAKRFELPIGTSVDVKISKEENGVLKKYYDIFPQSDYYFQPSIVSSGQERWVSKRKYASSSLQKTRTTTFIDVFIHKANTSDWGWEDNYVDLLKQKLELNLPPYRGKPTPIFSLAVWLYRRESWTSNSTYQDIVERFVSDFNITTSEKEELLDTSVPDLSDEDWQGLPVSDQELTPLLQSLPPDIQDINGILSHLETLNVGPSLEFVLDASRRLNLVTGDNGLGKSFLLEVAWWSLTGNWAQDVIHPMAGHYSPTPSIIFQITGDMSISRDVVAEYDWLTPQEDNWVLKSQRYTTAGIVVYAQIDGSIAVYDPLETDFRETVLVPRRMVFSREDIWHGRHIEVRGQNRALINGMLDDLLNWQRIKDPTRFDILANTLKRLSPPENGDLGVLTLDDPERSLYDTREIPTIKHIYGRVPITRTSAGVKRILSLAYILVWTWTEHLIKANLSKQTPQKRLVIIIDEIEAHLHPKWQRLILPALMQVSKDLSETYELEIQFIVSTHSPLVLASMESEFDSDIDSLFHLDIDSKNTVVLEKIPYVRYGTVDYWLTSDIFELKEARSVEAESAIEEANRVMKMKPPTSAAIINANSKLEENLPDTDRFYPLWRIFASRNGVEL